MYKAGGNTIFFLFLPYFGSVYERKKEVKKKHKHILSIVIEKWTNMWNVCRLCWN